MDIKLLRDPRRQGCDNRILVNYVYLAHVSHKRRRESITHPISGVLAVSYTHLDVYKRQGQLQGHKKHRKQII